MSLAWAAQAQAEILSKMPSKCFEHSSYRIIYQSTGQEKSVRASEASPLVMKEILYKVSLLDTKESLGPMISGWAEIRFLDSNQYIVGSDLISQEQLTSKKEFYAYLWVGADQLQTIQDVRLKLLTLEEFPSAKMRVQIHARLLGEKKEDNMFPMLSNGSGEKKPETNDMQSAAPELNRKEKLSIIDQNIQKIQSMLGRDPQLAETQDAIEVTKDPVPAETLGTSSPRLTNDDLTKLLKDLDAKTPTISESQDSGE